MQSYGSITILTPVISKAKSVELKKWMNSQVNSPPVFPISPGLSRDEILFLTNFER